MAKQTRFLVPPRRVQLTAGRWRIPADVILTSSESADTLGLEKTAALLSREGFKPNVDLGASDANIRVVRSKKIAHDEGYRIDIDRSGVTVTASTDAGAFYGLATLREMIRDHGLSLPCCRINDHPAFARRAVYHDTARGKVPTLATLKGLADRLAEWKINELQLYVENAFTFATHPAIAKGYSPLTAGDITALRVYCEQRHIRLVPSLASFGHMEKVLIRKEYAHLGELPAGATLCPTDPASIKFVEELYADFLPLFETDDFNVCCDETWDLGRGRSYKACQKHGTGKVYVDFLKKIHRLCRKFGRRMNAWSDIVLQHPDQLARMPDDIVMLNWGYDANCPRIAQTEKIAQAGLPLMVCPGTSSWGTISSRWPNARVNIRQAAAQGVKHKAEGLLNTDWGDNGHRQMLAVSLMAFAFGAAESWNPGVADDERFDRVFGLQAFGERSGKLGAGIKALGSTYLQHGILRGNCDPMSYNLQEPLRPTGHHLQYNTGRLVDRYRPEALEAVLASLPEDSLWRLDTHDDFDALSLAEYAFSARLTTLYCLRSSIAWDMNMGETITKRAFGDLADCIDSVGTDFATLWRARNKPSLLRDNLRLFRQATAEARKLAHG